MVRRAILWTVSLILLGLAWLALDDITTGNQPHFVVEWTMVAAAAAWFVALAAWRLQHRNA